MAGPIQRPDLYVVARILETLCTRERRLGRTQLQLASGVNYSQFARYLEFLQQRGLVTLRTVDDGAESIDLTPKGYDAMMFIAKAIRDLLGDDYVKRR
ncbi:MAG: winged helix-turn-helix domain-containing protein [Thermoplasmata archaeon]|nr:winged helix-turn-helix domain-containing protein [Thermoplasmata archaeon]MCI4344660.1 winged helix-turn-helix domain-containing protein [Thermoplasmata archaeon]